MSNAKRKTQSTDSIDLNNLVRSRNGIHLVPDNIRHFGDLKQRIKTPLSDGRTTIYIRIDHNVEKVKKRYETYMDKYRGAGLTKIQQRNGFKLDTTGFNEL